MTTKPTCVGFIMDGNRRWARKQGLSTIEGHKRGAEVFETAVRWLQGAQIPHGVFYAFSTENWRRSELEVNGLLDLFREIFSRLIAGTTERKLAIRIIGRREDFSPDIQLDIAELESKTKQYAANGTIWVALSYGGRADLIAAVNKAILRREPVDEESFATLLSTEKMPDPDIIMRSSGEKRLSNFLPWESVYSELHFVDTNWPALTEADFDEILTTYAERKRRHGT